MKNLIRAVAFFGFVISLVSTVDAQTKKAVILVNSTPFHVSLLPDGEIVEIGKEAKGYMRGFKRSADEFNIPVEKFIAIDSDDSAGTSVRRERNFINFETSYATLDENASVQLDIVAKGFKKSSDEKILITAHKSSDSDSEELYSNRIATCKTYLELKGIPASRIMSEIVTSSALKDRLSISYIQ